MVSDDSHKPRYRGSGVVAGNLDLVPRMLWTLVAYFMRTRVSPSVIAYILVFLSIACRVLLTFENLGELVGSHQEASPPAHAHSVVLANRRKAAQEVVPASP